MLDAFRPYTTPLWILALVGLLGLNGVFLYTVFARPDLIAPALFNPLALAFIAEAFVMMFFGAWAMHRLGVRRPGPLAFIVLSLVGGLAFSVPAVILLHLRRPPAA